MEGGVLRRNAALRRVDENGQRITYGRTIVRVDVVEFLRRLQQRGVAFAQANSSHERVLIVASAQGRNTKEAKNLAAERAVAVLVPCALCSYD